ncbi:MAG: FAD-dependent oxidoreductase [Gammaproteobacteria bacterium]|jgi:dimethylamine/trimethylamine dehydrogenase|nr:FAD-dependent oxidoreductase [Gammaproteobacteria bacterium]
MSRDPKHDILFEPIKIGPKTMKNRFYQVPHCIGSGSEKPGAQAGHRGIKAEGGWGGISTEYCSIATEADDNHRVSARIWDEGDVINLRHLTDTLHKYDALAAVELYYGGNNSANLESRAIPMSSMGMPGEFEYMVYAHQMDEDDIKALIQKYVVAAKRSVEAGFDILYLYGGHNFLGMQFLNPALNLRTDKYGGSLGNRARFWLETLEALKKAVGDEAAIATRFSVDSLLGPDGFQRDDALSTLEMISKGGLFDVCDVHLGTAAEWGENAAPSRFYKAGHERPWTNDIKSVINVPLIGVSRETSPDDMAAHLHEGRLDIIGAARPSIADPFLPKKIEEGRYEDIRECIGCNICISRWEIGGPPMICTQNATAMEEYRRGWHPEKYEKTKDPCSVLVVGAGPAGMECARVLGERGYDVHLREADNELGGRLRKIVKYPGLSEWGRLVTYRQLQLDKLKNVEVHLGVGKMSADEVIEYGADKVVLATGSHWAGNGSSCFSYAPVSGIDASQSNICTPEQILMEGKEVGDRVIILDADGYFSAVSTAEYLADQGKQVTILTAFHSVAPYTELTLESPNLHRMMHEKNIQKKTLHWVEKVEKGVLTTFYTYRDGYKRAAGPSEIGQIPRHASSEVTEMEFDTLVLCTARQANDSLYKEVKALNSKWEENEIQGVYQAGDCYAPQIIAQAIFEGHRIAREFESSDPRWAQPWIRERQIWGAETYPKISDREVNG